ncbi:MAG: DMT family transporter [Emcibacter sp.]|nr:DMT family transporter [Emcibacter sp.]
MIIETPTNNLKGIGFVIIVGMTMAISALIIRTIGKDLVSFEVIAFRCGFSLLYLLLLNGHKGRDLFAVESPYLLTIRSFMLAIVVIGSFYAIVNLPLVQVTAIQFTKPLFLVILAAIFLGEKIHLPRTLATICGFIGILIVLRPESTVQLAQIAVLAAAIGMAFTAIITKKLTRNHSTSTMVFYGNFCILLVCLGPTIFYWVTPNLSQIALIAALGVSTYLGQTFMVQAYRYGETTVVTPFEYLRIVFVAAIGYFIFSEVPDTGTVVGTLIICASTLFIAVREARKKTKKT